MCCKIYLLYLQVQYVMVQDTIKVGRVAVFSHNK